MPFEVLKDIKPRKYQEEIFNNCKDKNCLVVLPTGIGKTLIALMLSVYTQKQHPGTKTVFLAPTRPLAEQHLEYFKKHLPELFAELTLFTGKINAEKRKELWQNSDIIFSTPQCVGNDLKNGLYDLSEVSLLIEDECHKCLKNYAYTYISQKYKEQAKFRKILGLTASPGVDKTAIQLISTNLGIESIEIRTRDSIDVKEYLQELEFDTIYVKFPTEIKEIVEIIRDMQKKKIEELKNRRLLFGPANKITLLKLQAALMKSLNAGVKNFNTFSGVSACSQALKLSHLIELLETQTLQAAQVYMKGMFEQANENRSKAVKVITKSPEFNKAFIMLNELTARGIEHPKILELKGLIEKSIKDNPKNKTIVFSQYRETGSKIIKELNSIPGVIGKVFVGQTKKGESGLSQKEQHAIMEEFRIGSINVIAATSIAEEGLDIPEVNSVIFYEPIPSAIRKIQRAGRTARLMKGKLIILVTEETLDEIFHFASKAKEKRMYKSLDSIKKDLDSGKLDLTIPPKDYQTEIINTKPSNDSFEKKDNDQKTLF